MVYVKLNAPLQQLSARYSKHHRMVRWKLVEVYQALQPPTRVIVALFWLAWREECARIMEFMMEVLQFAIVSLTK